MKLILQRVKKASVVCLDCKDIKSKNSIKEGLLIYVGFSKNCNEEKIKLAVNKILNLKLFNEENRFEKSLLDIEGEILVISNFTLFGIPKGRKLNFKDSLNPDDAKICFEKFVKLLKQNYVENRIKSGYFRHYMKVESELEGPLNIILEY